MSTKVRRSTRGRRWRRIRRALRAHPRRALGGGLVLVVALVGFWAAWQAFGVARDLGSVDREAQIMRAALERGDAPGAERSLDRFRAAADSAEGRTDGGVWRLVERLPWLGDDARGVATVSSVLADLGRDGVAPIIDATEQVSASSFQPHDGRFPVERIAELVGPVEDGEAAFDRASRELDAVDADGFVGILADRFTGLRDQVDSAKAALDSTGRAAALLPSLLGTERPHDYLLVLQNNAELRSTGGLPGSVTLLRASDGRVGIVKQVDMSSLGSTPKPILPLDREERAVFGDLLGRTAADATLTPDTPRAAELIRAHWQAVEGGRIDGVFFVDPVAVAYLMQGLGPVTPNGYPEIDSTTVVAAVENAVYRTSTDRAVHSDYQNAVAKSVFNAFASGAGDPVTMVRGLATAVGEGRIRMHSFNAADQEEIAGTEIAGEFTDRPTDQPQVGVYINDSTESKMSYYLKYDASLAVRACQGGIQSMAVTMSFTNDAPPARSLPTSITGFGDRERGIRRGQQYLVVYVTSPVDGRITELAYGGGDSGEIDDVGEAPAVQNYRGREVATVGLKLGPGETRKLRLVARSGLRQTGDPQLTVTPGAFPGSASEEIPSAC